MVMALVNIVVPFILIAFGEQSIDSALASILNDPLTLNRIAGTALVIAGIALVNSGPTFRRVTDARAARTTPASERS